MYGDDAVNIVEACATERILKDAKKLKESKGKGKSFGFLGVLFGGTKGASKGKNTKNYVPPPPQYAHPIQPPQNNARVKTYKISQGCCPNIMSFPGIPSLSAGEAAAEMR